MRLALDQRHPVTGGAAEGVAWLDRAAAAAAAGGADLLILPEMALTGYNIGAEAVAAAAEPEGGALDLALAEAARRHGLAIVAGYPRQATDGRAAQLRSGSSTAAAQPCATYAKTHLFGGVDRAQFAAGDDYAPVVEFGGWRLGLAICYDIEFPETARLLALAGAEAILAPTANMAPFDSVALRLVPSRAEENALYVAYANYCGAEGEFDYVGLCCVCGPDGADIARAGRGPEMIFADLDRAALEAARARSTQLADRRPDLYAPLANPEGPR